MFKRLAGATWVAIILVFFPQMILAALSSTSSTSPTAAKITSIHISNPANVTQFVLEINGAPFRYQWKLSPNKKHLNININNTTLAATNLPKASLSSTPIKDYQVKPQSNKSSVQLEFQLKTALTPKIYTLPASGGVSPRLLIDFKSGTTNKDLPKEEPLKTAQKPIVKAEEPQQPLPKYPATKPNLTLSDNSFNRPIVVVIDPGHGGQDPGAVGAARTREKDIVLAISKVLQRSFNKQPGFEAKLTRNHDVFIPLRERLTIARRHKADIFIAIHADAAYKNQDAVGASVFALSERGATSEMARWLAKKENESELIYGVVVNKDPVLRSVLLDLSQTHTIAVSLDMGREILKQLSNITKLHYKRVEQAAFVVLKSPDIPSLLVETGYVSNPGQEQKLKDPAYQQQLANTIVQGVVAYFAQHPPGKRLITT